ncbi:MAG TPA: hypothetical protein DEF61_05450 [Firmicutes bacterium]|nr:hypothetical protein [Bacillota bacterium]HBM70968.1 hypothetical protein [Bacillota bacterium]HBX25670.1 hypothetical protein [Bacillota bacterium]
MVYLFDFDGTLFDTKLSLRPVYKSGFKAIGINDISNEECDTYMHYSLKQTLEMKGVSLDFFIPFATAILKALDSEESLSLIKIFPEVKKTLDRIKSSNETIGLVSGNSSNHIRLVLKRFGLESYFKVIVGSDMYKNGKPDPEPILLGCKLLSIIPNNNVVYVGDSLQDEECARRAGVSSFIVDRNKEYDDKTLKKGYSLFDLFKE